MEPEIPLDECVAPPAQQALPQGVADRAGLLFTKIASEMLSRVTPGFTELGLDGRDYYLLAVLSNDAPGSQAELASLCSLLPAQLVPVLDVLERKGLVERRRDERDRRRLIVRITDEGRARLQQADAIARDVEHELLGDLGDELRERLGSAFGAALPGPAAAAVTA